MINSSIVSKDAMNSFNKLSPLAVIHPPPPRKKYPQKGPPQPY